MMDYMRLCESILDAMGRLKSHGGDPKEIYITPELFRVLKSGTPQMVTNNSAEPKIFDMKIHVTDLPGYDFAITQGEVGERC